MGTGDTNRLDTEGLVQFVQIENSYADWQLNDVFHGDCSSDEAIRLSWNVSAGASAKGNLDCVTSWLTDFRADLPRIDVPTLISRYFVQRPEKVDVRSADRLSRAKSDEGMRISGDVSELLTLGVRLLVLKSDQPKAETERFISNREHRLKVLFHRISRLISSSLPKTPSH